MSYEKRLTVAGVGSVLLHVAFLIVLGIHGYRTMARVDALAARPEPIVLRLQRPETPMVRRLIDTPVLSDETPESTDLIGEHSAKARDLSDVEGTRLAPYFEEASEFDELRLPAPVAEPRPPAPVVPPRAEPEISPVETDPREEGVLTVEAPEAAPDERREEPQEVQPDREPLQVAQAEPPPLPPGAPRGRVVGGVANKGFVGFEALEHEIAPYLKEVRARVERNWRAALQLRYSGTTPTKAVLDCSIRPDGMLEHVQIVEAGDSATYAPLCKQAVERAAPFPRFPFEVPEMYRERSLKIRWTFSFLM